MYAQLRCVETIIWACKVSSNGIKPSLKFTSHFTDIICFQSHYNKTNGHNPSQCLDQIQLLSSKILFMCSMIWFSFHLTGLHVGVQRLWGFHCEVKQNIHSLISLLCPYCTGWKFEVKILPKAKFMAAVTEAQFAQDRHYQETSVLTKLCAGIFIRQITDIIDSHGVKFSDSLCNYHKLLDVPR